MSTIIPHRGATLVSRAELATLPVPPSTKTSWPISHSQVLDTTIGTLTKVGYEVVRNELALTRNQNRLFATLDLRTPIVSGVQLVVGIANALDKRRPISFLVGYRVYACNNLAFSAEIMVARKHTKFGERRLQEAICKAVKSLDHHREREAKRIQKFKDTELSAEQADALILRTFEQGILNGTTLKKVIREWRQPKFNEFEPRTLWSLFNAFTSALAERQKTNPQRFASLTIQLQEFIGGQFPAKTVMPTAA